MRSLFGLFAIALLGACLTACGSVAKGPSAASRASSGANAPSTPTATTVSTEAPGLRGLKGDEDDDDTTSSYIAGKAPDRYDGDFDNDSKALKSKTFYDSDDSGVRDYGQAANAVDSREITALAKRYYAAAAAGDGARGCSLMYSLFAEAIPEDYGRGAGPAYSRGSTCPVVMSKLFKHNHAQIPAKIVVTAVRVNGHQARALIGSKTVPASSLLLKRENHVWKVYALFAVTLP